MKTAHSLHSPSTSQEQRLEFEIDSGYSTHHEELWKELWAPSNGEKERGIGILDILPLSLSLIGSASKSSLSPNLRAPHALNAQMGWRLEEARL